MRKIIVNSKTSTTGVIMATYEPAGAITTGSFALEQPAQAPPAPGSADR